MPHEQFAELAAVVGALGAAAVLLARSRLPLLAGFALLAVAEVALVAARVPREDLDRLTTPQAAVALVAAALMVAAGAVVFVRWPEIVPVALLVAAPFRLPVDLGAQHAFLLLPLYGALAAAGLALVVRAARGDVAALPLALAAPVAAFIALAAVSLTWSLDPKQGTVELVFFLFPAAALVAVVARAPIAPWLARALVVTLVALGSFFAVIGIWQAATHRVFFARDLEVANAYTTYFRVTSLFKDPSLYGRHLVLAIAVLLVALWLGKIAVPAAVAAIALLFVGLWFSYSQSSMATLFAVTVAVTIVLTDRRTRLVVTAACVALLLAAAGAVAATAEGSPWRKATSGRSHLAEVTLPVIRNNPLAGAGVGAQPLASRREADTDTRTSRNASHTTPLTVAAELGLLGVIAYLALLAVGVRLVLGAIDRDRAFGLGLAAVLFALVLFSLVYAGFFEDPIAWGALALAAAVGSRPAAAPGEQTQPPVRRPAPSPAEPRSMR